MKAIEPRGLLIGQVHEFEVPSELQQVFNVWKKIRLENCDKKINELEIFYVGYVLSNSIVREQYKKEIEKY
jgi:hypothetical protein